MELVDLGALRVGVACGDLGGEGLDGGCCGVGGGDGGGQGLQGGQGVLAGEVGAGRGGRGDVRRGRCGDGEVAGVSGQVVGPRVAVVVADLASVPEVFGAGGAFLSAVGGLPQGARGVAGPRLALADRPRVAGGLPHGRHVHREVGIAGAAGEAKAPRGDLLGDAGGGPVHADAVFGEHGEEGVAHVGRDAAGLREHANDRSEHRGPAVVLPHLHGDEGGDAAGRAVWGPRVGRE